MFDLSTLNKIAFTLPTKDESESDYCIKYMILKKLIYDYNKNIILEIEYSLHDLFTDPSLNYYFFGKMFRNIPITGKCLVLNFYHTINLWRSDLELLKRIEQEKDNINLDEDAELDLVSKGCIYLCKYGHYELTLKGHFLLHNTYDLLQKDKQYEKSEYYDRFLTLLMIKENYAWREEI